MIYLTGDTHGDFRRVANFCDTVESAKDDVLIINPQEKFCYMIQNMV